MNPTRSSLRIASLAALAVLISVPLTAQTGKVLTGEAAFTDYSQQKPGLVHKITKADLPAPYATKGVDNGPNMVKRPDNAWPQALPGFKVSLYYTGLDRPREIRTAPNGDLFVALSDANKIMVFRGLDSKGSLSPKRCSPLYRMWG